MTFCVTAQTAKIWKIEKINSPESIQNEETLFRIFIETSTNDFNYPTIRVVEMIDKKNVFNSELTYYIHPGNDAEYIISIPNKYLKNGDYEIIFSRSLTKLGEKSDFYLSNKKVKRKLKRKRN